MSARLRDLLDRFQPDEWRRELGFSPEIREVHKAFFTKGANIAEKADALNGWIQKH